MHEALSDMDERTFTVDSSPQMMFIYLYYTDAGNTDPLVLCEIGICTTTPEQTTTQNRLAFLLAFGLGLKKKGLRQ